jgi:hypothetical protein
VPYTGATAPVNLGGQELQTSYVPTVGSDVVNLTALSNSNTYVLNVAALNYVPYTGATGDTTLGTYKMSSSSAPTTGNNFTNKTYVDGQTALLVPYTGATSSLDLGTNNATAQNVIVGNSTTAGTLSFGAPSGYLPWKISTDSSGRLKFRTASGSTPILFSIDSAGNIITAGTVTASTAQFTGITSATPSLALGVDGSGNLNSFPVPTATNLLPLNNTWTGTNTFNNNLTLGDGYNATLAEIGYIGQNNITSATPTTTGITAIAPTPTGTITFSTPTYTMTPSGASTFASFWSSATFTGTTRCFFNFTNMSLANAPGSATITVCQANTANTAYVAISSAIAIPQSAPIFSGYFTPNTNASYLGQVFFILSNVKFNPFSWTAFTYGYGAWTVQGNETVNGTIYISNNGTYAPPATGSLGGSGDRLILYPGSSGVYPYSMGIDANTLWYSCPTGQAQKWYVGGVNNMTLNSGGTLVLTQPSGGNQLQLTNSSANAMYMNFNSNGGAGIAYIGMDSSAGTGLFGSGIAYSFDIGTNTATPICFFTSNVSTPRMTITSSGSVGIGTTSPSYPLDVNGNFRAGFSTAGYVTQQGAGNPLCGYTEYKNGSTRQGYIGYGTVIGTETCLDFHAENGWGMDFLTTSHNIYFYTDGGTTPKVQIGTVGVAINGGTGAPALTINSSNGNPVQIVDSTADSNILFSCTGAGGRSYYVGSGGTGSGGGAGNFYIYDSAVGTRFAINSSGQTIIGGLGMTTNVPFANTYFYNSSGTYTGTSSTFGAYRYITFDGGRIYGAFSVATFSNGTITPLYNGMYCITFMAGGTSGSTLEIFISRNLHNNNDFNTGIAMDGLLACAGVVANETTITWTGYLATTDVVCCGCYTSGSAWTPYIYRSGITIALIQRMS